MSQRTSLGTLKKRTVQHVREFEEFCAKGGIRLRAYQMEAGCEILESVRWRDGRSFVVMFPRQSGKNELQAWIEAYLMFIFSFKGCELVKVSPTWRPQSLNALRRLARVLRAHPYIAPEWRKESNYILQLAQARTIFLSGAPGSNIVGATASHLLEVDEAQDVLPEKFDREIAPMAASTNATRVFWGTAWTAETLLGRELRASQEAQARDGKRRVFRLTADEVGLEVPAYRQFVAAQVARWGRAHPTVRTQYFSEEIEAGGGLFTAQRMALVEGEHAWQEGPKKGAVYAFLLDVGGEEKDAPGTDLGESREHSPRRDSTALVVVEVGLEGLRDPALRAPLYRVVSMHTWTGESQTRLYGQLTALQKRWGARQVVVDATGLGAGLAAWLEKSLPGRVTRFEFNAASKTRLGWDFLGLIEMGRFRLPQAAGSREAALVERLRAQMRACTYQLGGGPAQSLHWSVPETARDPASGDLLHDDLLMAAALCSRLDALDWRAAGGRTGVIPAGDPLAGKVEY